MGDIGGVVEDVINKIIGTVDGGYSSSSITFSFSSYSPSSPPSSYSLPGEEVFMKEFGIILLEQVVEMRIPEAEDLEDDPEVLELHVVDVLVIELFVIE